MKRWCSLLAIAVIAIPPAPAPAAVAPARSGCIVVSDPVGDTRGGLTAAESRSSSSADILTVSATLAGDILVMDLAVRALDAGWDAQPSYSISWALRNGSVYGVGARLKPNGWTFAAEKSPSGTFPVEGSVDTDAGVVRFEVPTRYLRGFRPSDPIGPFRAGASAGGATGPSDSAPNDVSELRAVPLDGRCARAPEMRQPGRSCLVATDVERDAGVAALLHDTRAADLLALDVASSRSALWFELRVVAAESSDAFPPARIDYHVTWRAGRSSFDLWTWRTPTGPVVLFSSEDRSRPGAGSFNDATGTITAMVPLPATGMRAGTVLRRFEVETLVHGRRVAERSDVLRSPGTVAHAIGAGCARGAEPACPVVRDAGADEIPPTAGADGGDPAADLLAVGAETRGDIIRFSLAVAEPPSLPPPGTDAIGWTISWWSRDGSRWIAQAERTARGWSYRLGRRAGDEEATASSPLFGGTAVAGGIRGRVIFVDVPRDLLSAADGMALPGLGAISFFLRSVSVVSTYTVADQTSVGPYIVGTECAAEA